MMQTLILQRLCSEVKINASTSQNGSVAFDIDIKNLAMPVILPEYFFDLAKNKFDLKYISKLGIHHNYIVCASRMEYPLIWVFWWLLYRAEIINHKLQKIVYWTLRYGFNGGVDFVSECEPVRHWDTMIKHFINHKKQNKCIQPR